MNVSIQKGTPLGEIMQSFALAVATEVVKAFPKSLVEENGRASAKCMVPATHGYHYVYVGFTSNGRLRCSVAPELRALEEGFMIPLTKAIDMGVGAVAKKVVTVAHKILDPIINATYDDDDE